MAGPTKMYFLQVQCNGFWSLM